VFQRSEYPAFGAAVKAAELAREINRVNAGCRGNLRDN
jgi:hypothetical protein